MTRVALTNSIIDAALLATGDHVNYTRDVPNGFVRDTFPYRMDRDGNMDAGKALITPAKESAAGRGQVFYDVYCADLDNREIGISLKVSDYQGDARPPRNSILAGSKAEHLFGLLLAAKDGAVLPVIQFWQDAPGQWWRCAFDAGRVLREHGVVLTDGWREMLAGDLPNLAAEAQVSKLTACLGERPAIAEKGRGGALAVSPLPRFKGKRNGRTTIQADYVYLNAKISHHATGHEWVAVDSPRMPRSFVELRQWLGETDDLIG